MIKDYKYYVQTGYKEVRGWYSYLGLKTVATMAETQKKHGVTGSVCEIGVHHGRSFILLNLITNPSEVSVAYDLFEMQSENIDRSGEGDKEILKKNLQKFGCDIKQLKIITQNSLNLTSEKILSDAQSTIRFFSIDGGHTSEIVQNDLGLAEKTICNGGVVTIDDFFDEGWPGVAEGTCRYLIQNKSSLIPVAIFDDKIALTNNEDMKTRYQEALLTLCPEFLSKESEFFGHKVIVLYNSQNEFVNKLRRTKLWQRIKDSGIGNSLRRIIK
jgi:hypothetical protein